MYEVQGLEQFERIMKGLSEKMRRAEMFNLIRKVAGPVEKAAKQEAAQIESQAWSQYGRINSGNLEESIGRIRGKSKEFLNVQVAPRAKGRFKGFHAQLVQFGTDGRTNKKGQNRGKMTANPFMKRAFDKTLNGLRGDFEKQVAKKIEKFANT
tara:strand:+ start:360 stop:818 length:459 start_codon:yes stop_codon:yes gene_type:complete